MQPFIKHYFEQAHLHIPVGVTRRGIAPWMHHQTHQNQFVTVNHPVQLHIVSLDTGCHVMWLITAFAHVVERSNSAKWVKHLFIYFPPPPPLKTNAKQNIWFWIDVHHIPLCKHLTMQQPTQKKQIQISPICVLISRCTFTTINPASVHLTWCPFSHSSDDTHTAQISPPPKKNNLSHKTGLAFAVSFLFFFSP